MPDGHIKGNLNFVATRHGWTRNFTLLPDKVKTMSYATLESVLELNTLKIRAMSLRIFVEHPPASGKYVKIRPWKDDESLQSILIKAFFEERMENGTITALDIRDGNVRENDIEGRSKDGLGAKEWLKAHGLTRSGSKEPDEFDGDSQTEAKTSGGAGSGFLSAFGFSKSMSPRPDEDARDDNTAEASAEKKTEEDILRERGWGPPLVRRLTSRIPRKPQAPIEEKDIQEEGDGEEIEIPDAEEANGGARPEKNSLWRKKPNVLLGKKSKMGVVEIVKTPSDALKPASPQV